MLLCAHSETKNMSESFPEYWCFNCSETGDVTPAVTIQNELSFVIFRTSKVGENSVNISSRRRQSIYGFTPLLKRLYSCSIYRIHAWWCIQTNSLGQILSEMHSISVIYEFMMAIKRLLGKMLCKQTLSVSRSSLNSSSHNIISLSEELLILIKWKPSDNCSKHLIDILLVRPFWIAKFESFNWRKRQTWESNYQIIIYAKSFIFIFLDH